MAVLSIVALFLIVIPLVVNSPYFLHLFIIIGIYSIVVMGVILQFRLRLWVLGSATYWGIGAYCSALLAKNLSLPFWFCLPLAAIVTGIFGLCLGIVLVRIGGVGFLLLTMVVNGIFVEVMGHTALVGGWDGIADIPRPSVYIPFHGSIDFVSKPPYYYLLLFLILLIIVAFYALYRSRIGRNWVAIGSSAPLAAMIGVNLFRYRLLAFVISAFIAGMAGSFYAHYQGFLVPGMFDLHKSFDFMLYGVVGGLGFPIGGPITGSFISVVVPELLRISEMFERILFGAILILIILFLREGILGLFSKFSTMVEREDGGGKSLFSVFGFLKK